MTQPTDPRNRPFAIAAAIVVAISAALIFASSHTSVAADTPVRAQTVRQTVTTVQLPSQGTLATPASMKYHDAINVSAVAVAAYEN